VTSSCIQFVAQRGWGGAGCKSATAPSPALAVSTLRTDQTARRHTRAAKVEMDEVHDENCQNRPPSKAAGTPTSPERGKVSSKKARHSNATTERTLQSQIQKQGKEICQLHEIVSEFGQAGTPPSTLSRVQHSPLPGQAVYTKPTYHVSPPMYGGLSVYEYQQPCYPTRRRQPHRYRPEIEFYRSVQL